MGVLPGFLRPGEAACPASKPGAAAFPTPSLPHPSRPPFPSRARRGLSPQRIPRQVKHTEGLIQRGCAPTPARSQADQERFCKPQPRSLLCPTSVPGCCLPCCLGRPCCLGHLCCGASWGQATQKRVFWSREGVCSPPHPLLPVLPRAARGLAAPQHPCKPQPSRPCSPAVSAQQALHLRSQACLRLVRRQRCS